MEHVRDVEYVRVALLSPANAVPTTQDRGSSFNRLAAILFGLTMDGISGTQVLVMTFVTCWTL